MMSLMMMMMMMSLGLMTRQPMRVICVKMVHQLGLKLIGLYDKSYTYDGDWIAR